MKIENTKVMNFEGAFRGLRNPMNSWEKSDSQWMYNKLFENSLMEQNNNGDFFVIGPQDYKLAMSMINNGEPHCKFLRQIFVCVDIEAPLYFWSEFDTYKIGTVADSCSTIHKILSRHLELNDFEYDENLNNMIVPTLKNIIQNINYIIDLYNNKEISKINATRACKQILPSSYIQRRTITFNYGVIKHIYQQRKNHILPEWKENFINWINTLPYSEFIID